MEVCVERKGSYKREMLEPAERSQLVKFDERNVSLMYHQIEFFAMFCSRHLAMEIQLAPNV